MLTQLVKHLNTLPSILDGDLAQPLMHLVDALDQASEGHKPALFANQTKNPGRKSSAYWKTAKMQAVVAYHTLAEAGHSDPAKFVADEMNRAKLARRKGERQTRTSVMRFVHEYELSVHEYELSKGDKLPEVWISVAREKLSQFSANPAWPVSVSDATSYVRRAFASPRLQREFS